MEAVKRSNSPQAIKIVIFLVAESTGADLGAIQLVLNWFTEVERLVPVN